MSMRQAQRFPFVCGQEPGVGFHAKPTRTLTCALLKLFKKSIFGAAPSGVRLPKTDFLNSFKVRTYAKAIQRRVPAEETWKGAVC